MTDLPSLIARVEALTSPCQLTAALIVRVLYDADKDMLGCVNRGTFNPTASIDDAASLVPDGLMWTMDSWSRSQWSAGIWRHQKGWMIHSDVDHQSRTPALALCLAALRARALSTAPTGRG